MRDKSLRYLSRMELLELLIAERRRNTALEEELRQAKERLEDREIKIQSAGTLAEAALSINEVLAAADAAARQYLENVKRGNFSAQDESERLHRATEQRCRDMVEKAEREANAYWEKVKGRIEMLVDDYPQLRAALVDTQNTRTGRL